MADPDPIQQRIKIEADTSGAREASEATDQYQKQVEESGQAIDKATQSEERHEKAVDESTKAKRDAKRATDDHSDAMKSGEQSNESFGSTLSDLTRDLDKATFGLASMAGGFVGAGGLVAAFEAGNRAAEKTIERLQKIVDLANEAARATLDLHAVNQTFDEGEEKMVEALANMTGRDFGEMAGVLTQFRSSNAHLDRETQDQLIQGSLVPLMMSTDKDPSSLAKFIGRVSSTTSDPREINNLVNESISLAGEGDPSAYLGAAGELMVSGRSAGLEPAETLALLGFASGRFETAESKTMLRNVFSGLSADPVLRGKLAEMGISTDGDPLDIIRRMQAAGFESEQTVELFGKENAPIVDAMMAEMGTVNRFVEDTQAAVMGSDQANAYLQDLTKNSPRHANALKILQQQQQLQSLERRQAEQAQDYQIARNAVEFELEEAVQRGEIDASAKEARLKEFDRLASGGPDFRRRVRGTLRDKYSRDTPLDQIDYNDVLLEAADLVGKGGGLISDVLPGGNSSTAVPLREAVKESLETPPDLPTPAPDRRPSTPPAIQQGSAGSLGQAAGSEVLLPAISQLIATSERTNQLLEQQQAEIAGGQGYFGRKAASVINNYNGSVFRGDPLIDDLDGRNR
jgi:hypothetical protein